jgi:hypothetical protein
MHILTDLYMKKKSSNLFSPFLMPFLVPVPYMYKNLVANFMAHTSFYTTLSCSAATSVAEPDPVELQEFAGPEAKVFSLAQDLQIYSKFCTKSV